MTNLWQGAHELPVNKNGPPAHPPAVLVTVAQPYWDSLAGWTLWLSQQCPGLADGH